MATDQRWFEAFILSNFPSTPTLNTHTHPSPLIVREINTVHSDDILPTKVANASAWTKRNDDNSGPEGIVQSSSSSGKANDGSMTAPDLWTMGASELVAAQARERERRLDVSQY